MRAFALFVLVGGTGFLIDAGLTQGLIMAGVAPWLSRPPAIAAAMLFTWVANRTFTYRTQQKPSVHEALRYFSVAAVMALFNYGIYLALIHAGYPPIVSVALATAVQTVLSYFGYKKLAFGQKLR